MLHNLVGWTEAARRLESRLPLRRAYGTSPVERERVAALLKSGVRRGRAPIYVLLRQHASFARGGGIAEKGVAEAERQFSPRR